ncbi:hypothetical protein FEK66_22935 [Escherichia sp. E1130]|uniref:hypothetical protein n=1 Tax=Escherichia sp. E1130 TaxID=2041645 RepID=UPI0010FE233B|nr:hypothetical protein [Escherichia sp. E1130]TLI63221.1 hypothetical protein FEK66_22935 [Escherichia sp. E1130]
MNEPNYEYIGRCTVLRRRINCKLDTLSNIKAAISLSESSYLIDGSLVLNHSAADCIEDAASKYRTLLQQITAMAQEHNEYAPSAGLDVIDIRLYGINSAEAAVSGTGSYAAENAKSL